MFPRTSSAICLLALTLSLPACLVEFDDPEPLVESDQLEIVGGEPTTGYPAVVLLNLGGGLCTGTVISPKVVLTAKHCLETNAANISANFVSQIGGAGDSIRAVTYSNHPTADIGVVLLEAPAPVDPIPHNTAALEGLEGQAVTIVGFGVTSETGSDSGLKRRGVASLTQMYGAGEIATSNDPQGTCYGDSGGPNFMTIGGREVVAGVTSRGTAACGSGLDIAVRSDSFTSHIDNFIAANDPADCAADGRCAQGCAQIDVDCCITDGACVEECGSIDPECGAGPDEPGDPNDPNDPSDPNDPNDPNNPPVSGPNDLVGGCSSTGSHGGLPLALLAVLLGGAIRLRRRAA